MISKHYQSFQVVDVLRRIERGGVFKWRVVRRWYVVHGKPDEKSGLKPHIHSSFAPPGERKLYVILVLFGGQITRAL
jgi:hypothetical protein